MADISKFESGGTEYDLKDATARQSLATLIGRDSGKSIREIAEEVAPEGAEVPDALPNPYALVINGQVYDGSAPVSMTIEGGGSGGDGSTDTSALEQRIEALENQLYEEIAITSFTTSPAYFEKGATVTSLTLNWRYNNTPPILQSLMCSMPYMDEELEQDVRSYMVIGISATVSNPVSFTLNAYDGRGARANKSVSVTFCNGVYYGVAVAPETHDSAFVLELAKELRSDKKPSFTVNAGEGQYIYYCLPVSMGTCTFTVGGFTGGFSLVDTISFTNVSGYPEDYRIYRSDNANLGNTSVTVA